MPSPTTFPWMELEVAVRSIVLAPFGKALTTVESIRSPGPGSWTIQGDRPDGETSGRLRAAVFGSGHRPPDGIIRVAIGRREVGPVDAGGLELAMALSVMLCDPSREDIRRESWLALGSVRSCGRLGPTPEPMFGNLPPGPWVGRIWRPTDRVPGPDEDAVITIVDVADLHQAWTALVGLVEIERRLGLDALDAS